MLSKIYDVTVILLIVIAITIIGYIFWNREALFDKLAQITQPNDELHDDLTPKTVKIPPRWLPFTQNLRNKAIYLQNDIEPILYAADLGLPSQIDVLGQVVAVTDPSTGNVIVLEDVDGDNSADTKYVFASRLRNPYGLYFYQKDLYVTTENAVLVYKNFETQYKNKSSEYETVVGNLPTGGINVYKSLLVGPSGKIFVGIGSSCNACIEVDKRRGSIVTYNLDGSGEEIYATGLRSPLDMEFIRGYLYISEKSITSTANKFLEGQDMPDEINIVRNGEFYGWPFFVGDNQVYNPNTSISEDFAVKPFISLKEGSTPTGLGYIDNKFGIQDSLLVSLKGDTTLTDINDGYKIVSINLQTKEIKDFSSWVISDQSYVGIPSDVAQYKNGVLISDELNGVVYFFK